MASPVLLWFRDDYRLADHPALSAAVAIGAPVLCLVVLDDESPGLRPLGGAARWWLHGSLQALSNSLKAIGAEILIFKGAATGVIEEIAQATGATAIYWNRRYGAAETAVNSQLKSTLSARGVAVESFNGRLLNEPWQIKNQSGKPFRVFTPYSRAAMTMPVPRPLPAPAAVEAGSWPERLREKSIELAKLGLEPRKPDWAAGFDEVWQRGEAPARRQLAEFIDGSLAGYSENRDRPGDSGASRLSPHLRYGEISPRQVWHALTAARAENPALDRDAGKFLTELTWRDFCYQLLFDNPDLPRKPYLDFFERLRWSQSETALSAWRKGLTGYPIVDAGMRQLWQTGWMPNRVRMITASFLTKHLLVDWREGETWFWDTLVDADPANNAFNWQWVAGSGPDSSPFHRIFNPVTQGEKFDAEGTYVRAFVPELKSLSNRFLHKPWEAPAAELRAAGITLGETYPRPIVDHAAARARALDAFRAARDPVA